MTPEQKARQILATALFPSTDALAPERETAKLREFLFRKVPRTGDFISKRTVDLAAGMNPSESGEDRRPWGEKAWDYLINDSWPAQSIRGAIRGAGNFGGALKGEVKYPGINMPYDTPEAQDQYDQLIRDSVDLAGSLSFGSAAAPAPDDALRMGAKYSNKGEAGAATTALTSMADPFYLKIEKFLNGTNQNKAGFDQWIATFKNKGITQDELDWTGVSDLASSSLPIERTDLLKQIALKKLKVNTDLAKQNKYEKYTLSGGKNYREMLFTLDKSPSDRMKEILAEVPDFQKKYIVDPEAFRSPHWDEPNVLAHARMTDRIIDGNKTLFLEEIQSDWHQKGRKEGYVNDVASSVGKAPDAPFKKTWPDLVLKRMVSEAVEKGYDQIAWTDGKIQTERYKGHGEEGLTSFYDQEIPRRAARLFSKYGAKPELREIPNLPRNKVHVLPITPELRKAVLGEGFPLFANKSEAGAATAALTGLGDEAAPRLRDFLRRKDN